ncbi:hypothetical protein LWF15_22690 [Kineosporia rhizophila]|uniref:hypothetical protein n=1 Tax=Kineosporia rhizophila TaxID=84633 RepID=UPI001E2FC207|nr:hypothetical protein [Kineosporia rhizophila]MCE0538311.1 hypothetical protein [Kineosporia rhizophila]
MARLLIISRSLALGMRLTDLHEVDERSADDLEQHLPEVEGFDVLVLDVGDPVLAVNTVNSLREDEQAVPVMLISGYQPEWEQVEAQQVEGVHVVPLPITRQALLRGVAILLDEDPDLITVEPTGAVPMIEMGTADTSDDATVIATQPLPAGRRPGANVATSKSSETEDVRQLASGGSKAGAAQPGSEGSAAEKPTVTDAAPAARSGKAQSGAAKAGTAKPSAAKPSAAGAATGTRGPATPGADQSEASGPGSAKGGSGAAQPKNSRPDAAPSADGRPGAARPTSAQPGGATEAAGAARASAPGQAGTAAAGSNGAGSAPATSAKGGSASTATDNSGARLAQPGVAKPGAAKSADARAGAATSGAGSAGAGSAGAGSGTAGSGATGSASAGSVAAGSAGAGSAGASAASAGSVAAGSAGAGAAGAGSTPAGSAGSAGAGSAGAGAASAGSVATGSAGSAGAGSATTGSAGAGSAAARSSAAGSAAAGSAAAGSARARSAAPGSASTGSGAAGSGTAGSAAAGSAAAGSARAGSAAAGSAATGSAAAGSAGAGSAAVGSADGRPAGPADVAAAKAVQKAAEQGLRPTGQSAQGSGQRDLGPSTGTLGQQIAARRMGQKLGPQHDRARRPGARPEPEPIQVKPSPVAGLSYSTPVVRPFSEQPPTGQFPFERAPQREETPPAAPPVPPASSPLGSRQNRWRSNPAPETGSVPMNSSNIAANRRLGRIGDRPRKFQRRADPADNTPRTPSRGLVTDPLGPRTDPYGFPVSALERRLDAEAAAAVTGRPGVDGEPALRTADLIRALHERSGELYGVSDTAQVLADDVIERASADAAAILVPDGPVWRVSGGVGLRPLERRLELNAEHWLITEVGGPGRAVLVDDTDIVRQQLAGAPLAAWRHLMAVPVPDVRVIVVLARNEEGGAFAAHDLNAVHQPVRESAALLAQAIETRRLARALAPLREPAPESGRPSTKG